VGGLLHCGQHAFGRVATCNASPDFKRYWRLQKVLGRDGGLRAFMREGRTQASYEQFTLSASQHPDLKVTVLVPVK
jgi:hypothetical protein